MLNRLWLAVLTLVALGAAPAAPDVRASASWPEPDRMAAVTAEIAQELQRAGTALELARSFESSTRATGASRTPAPGGSERALPAVQWHPTFALLALRPSALEAPGEVRLPHGEHLPYYATAPPLRG